MAIRRQKRRSNGVAEVLEALSKAFSPPPKVDPIQWLEEHRRLSPESSRELGPFHFGRALYRGTVFLIEHTSSRQTAKSNPLEGPVLVRRDLFTAFWRLNLEHVVGAPQTSAVM